MNDFDNSQVLQIANDTKIKNGFQAKNKSKALSGGEKKKSNMQPMV